MGADQNINEVIHAPIRLRICGMLRRVNAIDFTAIRDHLDIKDPSLSKHLRILAAAGYITVKKEPSISRLDSRRIAWVSLTRAGKKAFDEYLEVLTNIVDSKQ
jgi:DNA-binding MarR family transcriptional regulator